MQAQSAGELGLAQLQRKHNLEAQQLAQQMPLPHSSAPLFQPQRQPQQQQRQITSGVPMVRTHCLFSLQKRS